MMLEIAQLLSETNLAIECLGGGSWDQLELGEHHIILLCNTIIHFKPRNIHYTKSSIKIHNTELL